jgi:quercetin dioxygenase-like cupin family protein
MGRPWIVAFLTMFVGLCTAGAPRAQAVNPVRTLLASGRVGSVNQLPLYFRLLALHLEAGQRVSYNASASMLYALSGRANVVIDGTAQPLGQAEGAFVPARQRAEVTANGSAELLLFVLWSPDDRDEIESSAVQEIYRTPTPLPGLKAAPHEFSLTRVRFPAGMPANPIHYRSGAALYYVLSGTGAFSADGKTEAKPPGTVHFEPYGWVHQWGNPSNEPLLILQANISQEGLPAVLPGVPPSR